MKRKLKGTAFIKKGNFSNIINVFVVTFEQMNASLRKKILLLIWYQFLHSIFSDSV